MWEFSDRRYKKGTALRIATLLGLIVKQLMLGSRLIKALQSRRREEEMRALLNQAEILLYSDDGAFDFAN